MSKLVLFYNYRINLLLSLLLYNLLSINGQLFQQLQQTQPQNQQSPCNEIFQYIFDGNEWYGIMQVPSPTIGNTLRMKIQLSLAAQLHSNYVGVLELYGTREEAIQRILKGRPIRYRVRFPIPTPLPKLTLIQYNNQIICSGPPDRGQYVTSIRLEHTLYTELAGHSAYNREPLVTSLYAGEDQSLTNFVQSQNLSPYNYNQNNYNSYNPTYSQNSNGLNYQNDRYNTINNNYNEYSQVYQPVQQPAQQQHQQQNQLQNTQQRPAMPQQQYYYQNQPPANQPQANPPPPANQQITHMYNEATTTNPPQTQDSTNEVQCGTIDKRFLIQPLIVGGEYIKRGTWPWIAALYSNIGSSILFKCGGSLISKRTVLTAAHCLKPDGKRFKESEIIVFVGRHNINKWGEEGSQAADSQQIIIHPEYSQGRQFEADIGIIILTKDVTYNAFVRPVCLWPDGFNDVRNIVGRSGTVVGWGRDENGNLVTPEPKQTEIPIVDEITCLRSGDGFQSLTSNRTFCAGNLDKTGPCNGDSGSGLVIYQNNRWMLRGIVSIAQANYLNMCNLDLYVVFTDVAKFIPWIKATMQ